MKNLIFVLLVVLLSRMEPVIASVNENSGIRLQGNIENASGKPIDGELKVYVQEGFHSVRAPQAILPQVCPIEKGEFEVFLPVSHTRVYVSFAIIEKGEVREHDYGINYGRFFLAESSDDLYLKIQQNLVSVRGHGGAKWRCQYEIYQFGGRDLEGSIKAANEKDYLKEYEEIKRSNNAIIDKSVSHLKKFKDSIPNDIFTQLYYDIIGRANMLVLQFLKLSHQRVHERVVVAKAFFNEYFPEEEPTEIDTTPKFNSVFYANFLFERVYVKRMFSLEKLPQRRLPFHKVYNDIVDQYKGPMADKLIYLTFLWSGGQDEVLEYLDDAFERIKHPEIKVQITQFQTIHGKGEQIYNFSLSDTLGRIYTPEDFKGKTVLVDFWFTGCIPCKYLAIALDSLMEDYEDRDDVVFLSINVDKNEIRWRIGLRSGEYSSPGQICVTTGGMDHPLLKEYQYDSFPKLLIFDAEGKIVATNAPRPLDEESISKLKRLLD